MTRRNLRDAAAHARFHAARTGEPAPRPWLSVGSPPRPIEDACAVCGRVGPLVAETLRCLACDEAPKGGPS